MMYQEFEQKLKERIVNETGLNEVEIKWSDPKLIVSASYYSNDNYGIHFEKVVLDDALIDSILADYKRLLGDDYYGDPELEDDFDELFDEEENV